MSQSAQISLKGYAFTRISVIVNSEYERNEQSRNVSAPIHNALEISDESNLTGFSAKLSIRMEADGYKDTPYSIDMEIIGWFDLDIPERESRERTALLLSHNVLYAASREMLMTVTSRHVCGPFLLPLTGIPKQHKPPVNAEKLPKTVAKKRKSSIRRTKK